MAGEVDGRTVIVTDGTGSFGQTMARYLLVRGEGGKAALATQRVMKSMKT